MIKALWKIKPSILDHLEYESSPTILISSSLAHEHFLKLSLKSVHNFLSYFANKQMPAVT